MNIHRNLSRYSTNTGVSLSDAPNTEHVQMYYIPSPLARCTGFGVSDLLRVTWIYMLAIRRSPSSMRCIRISQNVHGAKICLKRQPNGVSLCVCAQRINSHKQWNGNTKSKIWRECCNYIKVLEASPRNQSINGSDGPSEMRRNVVCICTEVKTSSSLFSLSSSFIYFSFVL